MKRKNKHFWFAFGLVSAALLVYMLLPFVDVIVYGVFLYYVTRPIYKYINCRIKSKNISATIALFMFLLPVILIVVYAFSVGAYELTRFLEGTDYTIPAKYQSDIINELSSLGQRITPKEFWDFVKSNSDITSIITMPISRIADIVLKLFFMFTIGFYLLKDGRKLREWLMESSLGIENQLSNKFLDSVDKDLHRIFFGNILVALMTMVIGITVFYVLNLFATPPLLVPYPFLIGLLCGIAIFVPAIGIKIILIPLYIYLITQAYMGGVLIDNIGFIIISAFFTFMLVDIAPDIVLRPLISSRSIHPGIIILSYMFGVSVFGFMGLFFGPAVVVITTNFMTIIFPELRK